VACVKLAPIDDESLLPDCLLSTRRRIVRAGIYDAAEWYDVDYAGYIAELPFYTRLCERLADANDVVVEVGAGTGRLTLPLARAGHRLHAVEPALGMRTRLLSKAAKHANYDIVVEDALASTFSGPPQLAKVIIFPFNGLLHLGDRASLDQSLRHIHHRLADDGAYAFDMTGPYWETMRQGRMPWGRVDERVHPSTGQRFYTCDRSTYDEEHRTMHIDIRYALVDDDVIHQTLLTQFMWTTTEMLSAVEEAGFAIEHAAGDVDDSAFTDGSSRLLAVARKC
jgi:SAM-dependent methyltransferase